MWAGAGKGIPLQSTIASEAAFGAEASQQGFWLYNENLHALSPKENFSRSAGLLKPQLIELTGNKAQSPPQAEDIWHLFILTFLGASLWPKRTACVVADFLTSCGLVFSSPAEKAKGTESAAHWLFVSVDRQMKQKSFFSLYPAPLNAWQRAICSILVQAQRLLWI